MREVPVLDEAGVIVGYRQVPSDKDTASSAPPTVMIKRQILQRLNAADISHRDLCEKHFKEHSTASMLANMRKAGLIAYRNGGGDHICVITDAGVAYLGPATDSPIAIAPVPAGKRKKPHYSKPHIDRVWVERRLQNCPSGATLDELKTAAKNDGYFTSPLVHILKWHATCADDRYYMK